jgi:hypothetical protein
MSVTTITYSPAYNDGVDFIWSGVTFSSSNGGLTYTGSPTVYTSAVPNVANLTSVTIGNIVTSLGEYTFEACNLLTTVTIPNSVTGIGTAVFSSCNLLETVVIGDFVEVIGISAFADCPSLSSVIIGNSVTTIDINAFSYCTSLQSINLPNSVISIGDSAFNECTSLQSINIPNSVTSISSSAFTYCFALATVIITDAKANGLNNLWSSPTANPPGIQNFYGAPTTVAFVEPFTPIICFKEGAKILTDNGYILVQDLRNGNLVKTFSSGFKKIEHIGYSRMYHNVNKIRSKDKLYVCSISEYPELIEDLIITGCHSILVKSFKNDAQKEKTIQVNGNTYVTDNHYRLPACADYRTKIFEKEGIHTIWHFSLENSDYYMNYGVYANGLLVETTSNRMMVELSGMTLVDS